MPQIDNLRIAVAGKPIVNGMSLARHAGAIPAMMGLNGAGKSTLAYLLCGQPNYEMTGRHVR